MDYRSMFDRDYLGAWDFQGKDVTLVIAKVEGRELTSQGGRKNKKPVVFFEKTDKGLACNKTNAKIIAGLYGNDAKDWIGKRITLYPTTTTMGNETVECIRVRPKVPPGRPRGNGATIPGPVEQEIVRDDEDMAAAEEAGLS